MLHRFFSSGEYTYRPSVCKQMPTKKQAQSAATHIKLIQVAKEVFRANGYVETTTQEIIDRAGVTKGALYHHFASKPALFEAVYRSVEDEMAMRIQAASQSKKDPFDQLIAGCHAYLDACTDSELHRILRLDGPAALGLKTWAEIDREYGVDRLLPFISNLNKTGVIDVASAEAFAYQLTGAMNEATFWIAQHEATEKPLRQSKRVLKQLLDAIRV